MCGTSNDRDGENMAIGTAVKCSLTGVLVGSLAALTAITPAHASGTPSQRGGDAAAVRLEAAAHTVVTPHVADAYCTGRGSPLDCWVHEPVVTQPTTYYPAIQFQPGDRVSIDAGGCVQTGGHGSTWKRYVDPASDSDLYHGLINIPGGTAGTQRLVAVVGQTVVIGGSGGSLMLGYQDNNYSDNGYWGHDDGTGNQCKGVGNAWVHLVISF